MLWEKGHIPWNKGKEFTQLKGIPRTEEVKRKISLSRIGKYKGYRGGGMKKGTKLSEETKRRMSIAKSGPNAWNWKGGLSNTREMKAIKESGRRARRRKVGGKFTLSEWEDVKKEYGYICPSCKRPEPEIKLTIDHILPLIKGGFHSRENIQPLCKSCNSKKYIHHIKYEK